MHTPDRARRFADIAAALAEVDTTNTVEDRIVALANQTIDCAGACITHWKPKVGVTVAATTDSVSLELAEQIANDTGECVTRTVLSERTTVVCNDLANDSRWPYYGPKLVETTPIRSIASFYIGVDHVPLGVMSFFGTRTDLFTPEVVQTCEIFVDHALVALASAGHAAQAEQLVTALHHSRTIGMAMGILIHSHKIDETVAFDILRLASSHTNRKLRDIAREVVDTGELSVWRTE